MLYTIRTTHWVLCVDGDGDLGALPGGVGPGGLPAEGGEGPPSPQCLRDSTVPPGWCQLGLCYQCFVLVCCLPKHTNLCLFPTMLCLERGTRYSRRVHYKCVDMTLGLWPLKTELFLSSFCALKVWFNVKSRLRCSTVKSKVAYFYYKNVFIILSKLTKMSTTKKKPAIFVCMYQLLLNVFPWTYVIVYITFYKPNYIFTSLFS